jgi:hypothetical protein
MAQAVDLLFRSGKERMIGRSRVYYPSEENGQSFPSERVERATSADKELDAFAKSYGAWIDASVQKEATNTEARADLSIDGASFGTLPATALLNLEGKVAEIIAIYENVPTNDPAVHWTWDADNSQWRSPVDTRHKTEKQQVGIVLYDATPEHPAQTQLITRDVRVGRYETTVFSGALAQSDLDARLARARQLLVAVKKARAKANEQDASTITVAGKLFDFINGSKPQS